jgi:membrane-associated HD superfamily phosphohydrolase
MSDEANPVEGTEEQETNEQAAMAKQLEALQKQLEETRSAQSGSDRRVQELTKLLEQREKAAEEEKKTAEEKMAERMADIENQLQAERRDKQLALQRSVAVELLSEVGLKPPKYLDRLIGEDAETTEALIKEYIADKQAAVLQGKDEVAKKHGRVVTKTDPTGYGGMTYKEMSALSPGEFNKIPSEVVEAAMEAELKS